MSGNGYTMMAMTDNFVDLVAYCDLYWWYALFHHLFLASSCITDHCIYSLKHSDILSGLVSSIQPVIYGFRYSFDSRSLAIKL